MNQPTPATVSSSQHGLLQGLVAIVLVSALAAPPASAHTRVDESGKLATPIFALSPVEAELDGAKADAAELESIYRRHVRSEAEAATFFRSSKFLRLRAADQRRVIDAVLALEPTAFPALAALLPSLLREEYRIKAARILRAELPHAPRAMGPGSDF